jgi:hypothetical protein
MIILQEVQLLFKKNLYEARQTPSDTNVHVLNCLFRSISTTSTGGALYCNSVTCLLVESSYFISCKASDRGGVIYFNTGSGQSVYYEVCSYDCCSTGGLYGQFSYNGLYDVASTKNYVNYSSFVRCGTEISSPHHTICHHCGTQCYPSVNMSMNKCYGRSGIYSVPYKDSNSVTCSISYSTFVDNIATGYTCIMLQ